MRLDKFIIGEGVLTIGKLFNEAKSVFFVPTHDPEMFTMCTQINKFSDEF